MSKRTAKSLSKPPPIVAPKTHDNDSDIQFELELCWCVQQLEAGFAEGKLNKKLAEDAAKSLKILKSGSAPLIKKRQVMKAVFGDYRSKMKDEECKLELRSKHNKFNQSALDADKRCCFLKKAAIMTSGKDFRFNFDPPTADEITEDKAASFKMAEKSKEAVARTTIFKPSMEGGFKFNFAVDDVNERLDLNGLSIQ